MRQVVLLVILASCGLVASCGRDDIRRTNCVAYGEQCHESGNQGATATVITGPEGRQGDTGVPGERGPAGVPGQSGEQGPAGSDGTSCTVTASPGGAQVSCTDGTSSFISNGTDGVDGRDGQDAPPSPYQVVATVDPCGDKPGVVDEVLLKLANGQLLVLFADNSNGKNPRLAVLPPGNYMTSDGTSCYFTVDANNEVTNEHY